MTHPGVPPLTLSRESGLAPPLLAQPLASFVVRPPVSCAGITPVGEVMQVMARESIGAMVVVDDAAKPVGVFTLRELLENVALPGVAPSTPIERCMSRTLWMLPPAAHGFEAAILMAREGVRYVLVVDRDRLVGVVSESRLFAAWRGGIGDVSATIRSAPDVEGMVRAVAGIRELADRLLDERMPSESVTRVITALNDLVNQRLIELVGLAEPLRAVGGAWLAFGSQGRAEQTLATDQDNGVLFADVDDPEAVRRTLLPLATKVNEALDACGFPLCRGEVMASNPRWCLALSEWRGRFAKWIDEPDPQALLNAAIFFDFRVVHGEHRHADALRGWLAEYAPGRGAFLLPLVHAALLSRPPLGLVRDFVVSKGGEHPGTLDLKINGIQLFVETTRIYGLAHGVTATNTLDRLDALAAGGTLPAAEAASYAEAFRFLQFLRLRLNAAQRSRGILAHNHLDPSTLNELDRRILKEAVRQGGRLQSRLARDFSVAQAGYGA
jgi:CBS domain-containing protein